MSHLAGIKLDGGLNVPLYRQLVEQLSEKIRTGSLPEGFRLPPTRELSSQLEIHRNTVVRAFEELSALGYVTSTVGRGTYVSPQAEVPADLPVLKPQARTLPWDTLVSQTTDLEPFGRLRRMSRQAKGRRWFNLSKMEPPPDLFPVERFRHCIDHVLRTQKGRALGYAGREGLYSLRALIVEDLALKGIPTRIEDVMITTGSQQGLDLVARALLDPGDAFLLQTSTYTGAINIISAHGARSIGIEGDEEGPLLDALDRLNPGRIKGFYLMPNVCNPTGVCISEFRREGLIQWSHRHGIPLIEDDYAADLELDGLTPPPSLRALDPEVIYIGTFSKKLIPALRVGFLVCPPAFHQRILPLKHAMDLGTSSLLQHAVAEFLERGYMRAHLKQTLPKYRARRDALEEALHTHLPKEIKWNHASRGPLLWLSLPAHISPEDAFEEARREGVLVNPSTLHEAGPQDIKGGLRLVFLYETPERLAEAGKRLGIAMRRLLAQNPTTSATNERLFDGV